ncbi:MAG: alpha/beta fold hydrolase [Gemmatimonadaceae bacterium]
MEGRVVVAAENSWWLSCTGVGRPTVVLEAGHNESSSTWRDVQGQVAQLTRVCSYDRAGLGRSGSPPRGGPGRTARDVVRDLEVLMDASNERGPFVLVGHSLGGAFVRIFAATHPNEVVGLVLVDAVHEREFEAIAEILTSEQRAAGAGMRPVSPEGLDIEAVLRELRRIPRPTHYPTVVVARGRPLAADEMPRSWTSDQRQRREALRRELQEDLVRTATYGRLLVATASGHFVHHEEPELVVGAIRELVDSQRQRMPR